MALERLQILAYWRLGTKMRTSNHWKYLLALVPIIGTFANAQTMITYDSRYDDQPAPAAIDLAVRDRVANPDYAPWMLKYRTPAMIDAQTRIGVTITGTVAQAEADLAAAIKAAWPALPAEIDNETMAEALGVDDNAPTREALKEAARSNRLARAEMRQDARAVRTNMVAIIDRTIENSALTNNFTAAEARATINGLRRDLLATQREVRDLSAVILRILRADD